MCGGGVEVVAEALGQPHAADVEARVPLGEDELGRAAADVDDQRPVRERAAGSDSARGQLGLVVAGEQPGREPVAPLDLAEERLAVLRVADRTRRYGERAHCIES